MCKKNQRFVARGKTIKNKALKAIVPIIFLGCQREIIWESMDLLSTTKHYWNDGYLQSWQSQNSSS